MLIYKTKLQAHDLAARHMAAGFGNLPLWNGGFSQFYKSHKPEIVNCNHHPSTLAPLSALYSYGFMSAFNRIGQDRVCMAFRHSGLTCRNTASKQAHTQALYRHQVLAGGTSAGTKGMVAADQLIVAQHTWHPAMISHWLHFRVASSLALKSYHTRKLLGKQRLRGKHFRVGILLARYLWCMALVPRGQHSTCQACQDLSHCGIAAQREHVEHEMFEGGTGKGLQGGSTEAKRGGPAAVLAISHQSSVHEFYLGHARLCACSSL